MRNTISAAHNVGHGEPFRASVKRWGVRRICSAVISRGNRSGSTARHGSDDYHGFHDDARARRLVVIYSCKPGIRRVISWFQTASYWLQTTLEVSHGQSRPVGNYSVPMLVPDCCWTSLGSADILCLCQSSVSEPPSYCKKPDSKSLLAAFSDQSLLQSVRLNYQPLDCSNASNFHSRRSRHNTSKTDQHTY